MTIMLVIKLVYRTRPYSPREGFHQQDSFEYKSGNEIYDEFYSNIYDDLVYNSKKNKYEVDSITKVANIDKTSNLLEIGCGTGHHAAAFALLCKTITAIDVSQYMINQASLNYPPTTHKNLQFMKSNALHTTLFPSDSFSHILSLYFTIYYIKNKHLFFRNCYKWLDSSKTPGYLILHLVDRDHFDPVVPPSSPFYFVNPQTFAEKRITTSSVIFNDFKYTADFDYQKEKNEAVFVEKFENKENGKVFRKNEHKFFMESEEEIVSIAQNEGFIVHAKVDLLKAAYEHQYIYIFVKSS
jgi:SAM-dependent methyltransferase